MGSLKLAGWDKNFSAGDEGLFSRGGGAGVDFFHGVF